MCLSEKMQKGHRAEGALLLGAAEELTVALPSLIHQLYFPITPTTSAYTLP